MLNPTAKKPKKTQFTREDRIASYRTSRDKRVVENAFGILASTFKVLLDTMEQRPEVVKDIVLTCVVLHNMLPAHQGIVARAPT